VQIEKYKFIKKRGSCKSHLIRHSDESRNPELLESRSERDWISGRASLARNDDFLLLARVLQEAQEINHFKIFIWN